MTEVPGTLTAAEGCEALAIARRSLEAWVREGRKAKPGKFAHGLARPYGAFVTLHTRDGRLRGCIGHMVGEGPVGELIAELGIAAGTHDPRFEPVNQGELPQLTYEVSVLSPMVPTQAADVTPGTHGLYVRRGRKSGVLLPQVASEWGWDRDEFLCQTCHKAGLPGDAWQQPGTEILTFTAQIFSEAELR